MKTPLALGSALLFTTFLTMPAFAQGSAPAAPASPAGATPIGDDPSQEEEVEISVPGGGGDEIVITGTRGANIVRSTPEIVSVLSNADIARTGEGDIAGALQRVTGLSVVGDGFVYVRGLGDRYSLSLLNGSPLPSPEPLRRVVPLDIFPSRIVASALVQKSYSPNYPGEFGGGVINLTTTATPREPFFQAGVSVGGDSETTARLGYTYYGSETDFLGYDDGVRDISGAIEQAGRAGLDVTNVDDITALSNAETTLLQRNRDIPANFSADFSAGSRSDIRGATVGVIASGGYSSTWQVRDALQQSTTSVTGAIEEEFRTVLTDNRILVNGLIGIGAEIGDHRIRLTNVYIHDTVKQSRLAGGYNINVTGVPLAGQPAPQLEQNTSWFERELYDLQGVAELDFGAVDLDLRGTWAKTRRDSPYERYFGYTYNPEIGDYQNRLTGSDSESATIAFSELDEEVIAGGADLSYRLPFERAVTLTAGYAYTDTDRTSSRYFFRFRGPGGNNIDPLVSQLRPDYLLSDYTIRTYGIELDNQSASQAAALYDATLRIHAGYAMAEGELTEDLRLSGGVRYETADQTISAGTFSRTLSNDYFLPAATLTWNARPDVQFRLSGSKTIARPQFRELAPQLYQDFTSDREFIGNPFLEDSQLYNADARVEWYLGRDQRVSLAGFYKKIDNPIEAVAFFQPDGTLQTGFSNAPEAQLFGAEVEAQKYVPLDDFGTGFANKRLVLIGNYTFTNSELRVGDEQAISPIVGATLSPTPIAANLIFPDGAPLAGQSDHLVNLQIGVEDTERLSQATIMFTYASDRVTNRGPVSSGVRLPDLEERPGIRLDFVAREEWQFGGVPVEVKFEARNLTGTRYREFQQFDSGSIEINTFDVGTSFSLGASVKF